MIDQRIAKSIIDGNEIRIVIASTDARGLADLRDWLGQFHSRCGGTRGVSCNSLIRLDGTMTLDVRISSIGDPTQRTYLAGSLSAFGKKESSMITFKVVAPPSVT